MRRSALLLTALSVLALASCSGSQASLTPSSVDITTTASTTPQLALFSTMAQMTNVGDLLRTAGPFTVFAPSDQALTALTGKLSPAQVMLPENATLLQAFLRGHIVEGRFTLQDLQDGQLLKAVNGTPIHISRKNGSVIINDTVVVQDKGSEAPNGLLYVVQSPIFAGMISGH